MNIDITERDKDGFMLLYANVTEVDIDEILPLLSQYRRDKISRYKKDIDKKLSAVCEYLLIYGMRRCMVDFRLPLSFEFNKFGKAYLSGYPDLKFNFSHAGNYAVCVISDTEIGVDIEPSVRESKGIAEKYFSDAEKRLADIYGFSYIWTRKEAFLKCEGTGILLGLDKADVSNDVLFFNNEKYTITGLKDEISGYALSVCLK